MEIRRERAEDDGAALVVGALAVCVVFVLLIAAGVLMNGWLLSLAWAWFAVPLGAPALTFWQLVGVGMVVRLLRPESYTKWKDHEVDAWGVLLNSLVWWPMTCLVPMWVIRGLLP